jgi:predicted DCC family thiol-disulfide oxidoreductase YuxK
MRALYVLYEPDCELCRRCRQSLQAQSKYLLKSFYAQRGQEACVKFPKVVPPAGERVQHLIVVADSGEVDRKRPAWIMCFYNLREYRALAMRLARPSLRPLARRAYQLVSRHRQWISGWFQPRQQHPTDEALADRIQAETQRLPSCNDALCHRDHASHSSNRVQARVDRHKASQSSPDLAGSGSQHA